MRFDKFIKATLVANWNISIVAAPTAIQDNDYLPNSKNTHYLFIQAPLTNNYRNRSSNNQMDAMNPAPYTIIGYETGVNHYDDIEDLINGTREALLNDSTTSTNFHITNINIITNARKSYFVLTGIYIKSVGISEFQ